MNPARNVVMVAAFALCGTGSAVAPLFAGPHAVPVDRLIGNLTEAITKDPDDPQLIYNLARTHYLALVNQCSLVPATYDPGSNELYPASRVVAEGFIGHLLFDEATRRTKESMGVDDSEDLNREDRGA